mmetsp:Transcript_139218/g.444959  ORF Transcript_139218/g.444959 Transcript_139218/m.444959 type:complete len:742 (+) Transcript_139218:122-2347(+)
MSRAHDNSSRLGCAVFLVEPRQLLRAVHAQVLEDNGLVGVQVVDVAPQDVDVVVWEGVCEDTLLELGHLSAIGDLLRACIAARRPRPRLVPGRCRVWATLLDDRLPRIRGCDVSRLERLRGFELAVPRRWPRGACHIEPRVVASSDAVLLWDLELDTLGDQPPNHTVRSSLTFAVQSSAAVSGIGFWIEAPEPEGGGRPRAQQAPLRLTSSADIAASWLACVQSVAPRRATSDGSVILDAHLTLSRIWFEWPDEGRAPSGKFDNLTSGTAQCLPIVPPLGKTLLPPWHFKMLNDHVRNHMYDSAISRAVHAASARVGRGKVATKRPSVLDCGCGAGLLSLMATRAGAGAVCAMELSPVIADIAEQTFSVNLSEQKHHHPQTSISTASKIQLLAGDVRSFSTDQVGRHDVIICELMDASGVGESLLGVLAHACTFFAAPLAQVIPCKLRLSGGLGYLALPECHGSLNFAAFEPFYFCARRGGPFSADSTPRELQGGGIATPSPTLPALHTGPFASKNLNRLRRGERWDLLTFEAAFLEFDIASALRGSAMHPREAEVELVVKSSGVVNCIQWCWSAKLDEHETLSNRPLEAGGLHQTHWHQPLVPIGPLAVRAGDRLLLRVSLSDAVGQKLSFTLRPAGPGSCHFWAQPPPAPTPNNSQQAPSPTLPPEPLTEMLASWKTRWEQACAANTALLGKHTRRGDLTGLAGLQQAALAIVAHPRLFGCDPHVRDRLLLIFFGLSFK